MFHLAPSPSSVPFIEKYNYHSLKGSKKPVKNSNFFKERVTTLLETSVSREGYDS
jgi:hypothetical protein